MQNSNLKLKIKNSALWVVSRRVIIILIILISFGAGLWQGNKVCNIPINFLHLSLPLGFFIFSAFLLILFFFFWKKLHKSKPWLWGTGIGLFLMIICFLLIIVSTRPGGGLVYHYYGIIWILRAFGMHFLCSLPGILLSGLGPYLFFRGLKKKENKLKKIGLMLSGLVLIPVCLFLLFAVGLITTRIYYGD